MSSIFLFSQNQGRCVELSVPKASSVDMERLHGALPHNVTGISFTRPELEGSATGKVHYHSVSSPRHVSEHLMLLGDKMMNASQASAALGFYELALRIDSEASLHLKRGEALFNLGRVEEAQREVAELLKRDSQCGEAFYWMGKITMHKERYEEAVRYFAKAEEILSSKNELKKISGLYQRFAKIYQDRDQLHLKELSTQNYVLEIKKLQKRLADLREQIQLVQSPLFQGMEIHLEALDNLFSNWLRELSA